MKHEIPHDGELPQDEIDGWQDEVLLMIHQELGRHESLDGTKDMSATPPMMYPEAIRSKIAKARRDGAEASIESMVVQARKLWPESSIKIDISYESSSAGVICLQVINHGPFLEVPKNWAAAELGEPASTKSE